jgi:MinD-like ATPase involved in chromosome partitioning or flagellar assembly
VNQVANAASAADVHRRIDQSCRRFLGLSITLAGSVPFDPTAASAGRGGIPTTLVRPHSLLADAIARLARQISEIPGPVTSQQRLAA